MTTSVSVDNMARIFQCIQDRGAVFRSQVALETGFSPATVTNHVRALMHRGLIVEMDHGQSMGGRRPVLLGVKADAAHILGVNVQVGSTQAVLFDLKLKPVLERSFLPADMTEVCTQIEDLLAEAKVKLPVLGMGIAVPGLIDAAEGALEFAPNLGWQGVSIVKPLERRFNAPVVLLNEAKAGALGAYQQQGEPPGTFVYVSINEGIGGGVIIDGQLFGGASGNAGEFGHTTVESQGQPCHCGRRGCWETVASLQYIQQQLQDSLGSNPDAGQILEAAKGGALEVRDVLVRAGRAIGIGVANIVNGLSPNWVLLGGEVAMLQPFLEESMRRFLNQRALGAILRKATVAFAPPQKGSCLHGLVRLVYARQIGHILDRGSDVNG